MPISQKIIDRVRDATPSPGLQELMLKILRIEDNGVSRFEAEYDKAIKMFIDQRDKEVGD